MVTSLLENLVRAGRFGLDDASMRELVQEPTARYRFRARAVSAGLQRELRALATRRDASDEDRLWAFSFLEDVQNAVALLRQSDAPYVEFLRRCDSPTMPLFVRKMARFQLLLIAPRGFRAAVEYVAWVKRVEEDASEDIAAHLGEGNESADAFLRARLTNPELVAALPITAYRLGLFGDSDALPALADLGARYDDPDLRALIDEAVRAISERGAGASGGTV